MCCSTCGPRKLQHMLLLQKFSVARMTSFTFVCASSFQQVGSLEVRKTCHICWRCWSAETLRGLLLMDVHRMFAWSWMSSIVFGLYAKFRITQHDAFSVACFLFPSRRLLNTTHVRDILISLRVPVSLNALPLIVSVHLSCGLLVRLWRASRTEWCPVEHACFRCELFRDVSGSSPLAPRICELRLARFQNIINFFFFRETPSSVQFRDPRQCLGLLPTPVPCEPLVTVECHYALAMTMRTLCKPRGHQLQPTFNQMRTRRITSCAIGF